MVERILYSACPLCNSSALADSVAADCATHPLYHGSLNNLIRWKHCHDCGHVFTEGYYTDAVCQLIYSKTNPHQQVGADLEAQRVTSSRMVEKVLPYASEGHWLDVGFGNAALLFAAEEYGFTPVGLDVRADNVAALKQWGIAAHCQDISALSLSEPCAVISMADVLEHVPYPKTALLAARNLLADDGILFVSMPNSDSMIWQMLDRDNVNPYWGEIEHYHNFGRKRLYSLLREFGFEPLCYGISERYRCGMEVIAKKISTV